MKVEDAYEPIGKFVVKFQSLELITSILLIELINQDYDVGWCIVSEMSFARVVAGLVSVGKLRIKDQKLLEELHRLALQLNECENKRNTILHSGYFEMAGEVKRFKVTAKQRAGLKKIFFDACGIQEIIANTNFIDQTNKLVVNFVKKLQTHGLVSKVFFRFC
ncbi:MAG TPA: hypothetical protein VGH42_06430 [Verrucomicrobiae bacterium]|jgi:hypothetical protein